MDMLRSLKFVQGAIAKKDFLPSMTHFEIKNGQVRAYNGSLGLSSPIAFNIDCNPKAGPLVQAIANCNEQVTLTMTPTGRLKITSGSFKAFIECLTEEPPPALPEGKEIRNFDGKAMLAALKAIEPFIGNDASRQWTNGVLLRGHSAFATNNVILAEYWVGSEFPVTVNLPKSAVREMLRIDEAPIYAQVTEQSMTFHYSDGRWVRTQLFNTEWPDVNRILDMPSNATPLDEKFFQALETVRPFVDKLGRIFLKPGIVATSDQEAEGAKFDLASVQTEGLFQIEMLSLLQGVAKQIDFTTFPKPCQFFGDQIRGSIIGMHLPAPPKA